MTNEEYIKSLPTEAFMRYLTCKACSRKEYDEETDFCPANCNCIQLAWLKAEREE